MARVIGATVWQGSICQCQSLITWTDLSSDHSYIICIACHKRQGARVLNLSMPLQSTSCRLIHGACARTVCIHTPCMTCLLNCFSIVYGTVSVLCIIYVCTFCLIFCGQRFLHSDDGHVHATTCTPFSARALAQARPTMSRIRLRKIYL